MSTLITCLYHVGVFQADSPIATQSFDSFLYRFKLFPFVSEQ